MTVRYKPREIKDKLAEARDLREDGASIAQVVEKLGITENTYYQWKSKYTPNEVTVEELPDNMITASDGETFVIHDPPDGLVDPVIDGIPLPEPNEVPNLSSIDEIRRRAEAAVEATRPPAPELDIREKPLRPKPRPVGRQVQPPEYVDGLPTGEMWGPGAEYAFPDGRVFHHYADGWRQK